MSQELFVPKSELLSPKPELVTPLLDESYEFFSALAPVYAQEMAKLMEALNGSPESQLAASGKIDLPGYGVYGLEELLMPKLLTGRRYCHFITDVFSNLLQEKFPNLMVRQAKGRAYSYDPRAVGPLKKDDADFDHSWVILADPETLSLPNKQQYIVRVDGTVKQADPEAPFVQYTTNPELITKRYVPRFDLRVPEQHTNPLFEHQYLVNFSKDAKKREVQVEQYYQFMSALKSV